MIQAHAEGHFETSQRILGDATVGSDLPKPAPASFATEACYGVDAFQFINAEGVKQYGHYRIEQVAGQAHLSISEVANRLPDFLSWECADRYKDVRAYSNAYGFLWFSQVITHPLARR